VLNAALKAAGYAVDRLTFGQLDGYLRGFIDLVFEHRGRYYVLDWKSNHLGYAPEDYGREALAAAMAAHGYHLQALLYSVALARYLAQRVRDYRHDAHFGGVLYLFVRGVRPQWRHADGTATGVHFHRPSAATFGRIDALLDAAPRKAGP
jgi:exodeoxyribonuclease V beta subunit